MSTDPTIANDNHCFVVQPQTPQRQIRHRSSLEHVLSFTLLSPAPTPNQITEATFLYHRILDDCQEAGIVLRKPAGDADHERTEFRKQSTDDAATVDENFGLEQLDEGDQLSDYDEEEDQPSNGSVPLHKLFRAIYEYSPTTDGQVNIVRIVLHGLFPVQDYENPLERALLHILPRARRWISYTPDEKGQVYRILAVFAADFLQGFFVPLKAQGRCTPNVSTLITPTTRTEVGPEQGTPNRLSDLRKLCLARDGGRCVLTRTFDSGYLKRLYDRSPRRRRRMEAGGKTEAAHIIPHSLNALAGEATTLPPAKRMVWRILNMFSPGISATLAGPLIDTPVNALMLISELHDRFGKLECYLEAGTAPNSYTFHTVRGAVPLPAYATPPPGPIVFANNERAGMTLTDLPSPRLLAIHRACCMMLSMSGAAEYVENLLDDTDALMQRGVLAEDGSSNFALLLKLRGVQEELVGETEDRDRPLLRVVLAQ